MEDDRIIFHETYDRRKLNALYREIPLKDTTFRTLRKYFTAMALLYGAITLKKAYGIIKLQCPGLVTEDEFLAFAEIARHEYEGYEVMGSDELFLDLPLKSPWDREIIDGANFICGEDDYFELKRQQEGKPYYIPEKKELLRYADWEYREETPQRAKMRDFLQKRMKLDENKVTYVLQEIDFHTRHVDSDRPSPFLSVDDLDIEFQNDKQLDEYLALYQELYNNSRMQCNRGHTPTELLRLSPEPKGLPDAINLGPNIRRSIQNGEIDARDMMYQILAMDLPSEALRLNMLQQIAEIVRETQPKLIPRNAPCPCGSGKKYKRCCGKNLQ